MKIKPFLLRKAYLSFAACLFTVILSPAAFAAPADHYVITIDTTQPGTSDTQSFTIPTYPGETYNYSVDTNNDTDFVDLEDFQLQTGDLTIDFGAPGTYTIRIEGTFPGIYFNNGGDAQKLLSVDQWGTIAWERFDGAYYGATNMNIAASDNPILTSVNSFQNTFRGAENLNADLSGWTTTSITNLNATFLGALIFDGNITTWDVSNVENFGSTFNSAEAFDQNIGGWVTDSATFMEGTFNGAESFNQDIGSWNLSSVTDTSFMFRDAVLFNQDLDMWDVSSVTNMEQMFYEANVFDGNITTWDTSSVIDMNYMFFRAYDFDQPINYDPINGYWDTSSLQIMNNMFSNATSFNQFIGDWDTSSVTNMSTVFNSATLFNQGLSDWDTSSVTNMEFMFANAPNFDQPIGAWDTGQVQSMRAMFSNADDFDQNLNNWDTSSVTNMSEMFSGADSFNGSISDWDTSLVTDMSSMFFQADAFNQEIGDWNVSSVVDMDSMFEGAQIFNQPLNQWDVSSLTGAGGMFSDAVAFDQPLGNWNTISLENTTNMFNGATSFDQDLGNWNVDNLSTAFNMFSGVELSRLNYDSLLEGWSEHAATGVTFSAGNSTYCDEDSRNILTSNKSWTITDGGLAANCPISTNGSSSGSASNTSPFSSSNSNGSSSSDTTSSSTEPEETLDPTVLAVNEKLNNLPLESCLLEDNTRDAQFTDGEELPSNLDILTRLKASADNDTYLLQGNGDGSLALSRVLNRAEAVKLILVSHCLPILNEEKLPDTTFTGQPLPNFSDLPRSFGTPTDRWLRDTFYSAAYYEIIRGTDDGTAEAAREVNAAEYYTMLSRMADLTNLVGITQSEVPSGQGTWYEDHVGRLITETLLDTNELISFNYDQKIDRLTALQLIARAIQTRSMLQ